MARRYRSALIRREGQNLDKTLIGLIGGASALALLGGAQASAAPTADEVMLQPARSFAELLDPIPNAEKVLRADNERVSDASVIEDQPMVVAEYYHHHHHHHYHHHYHHHHHHHYHHHYY